MPLQGELVAADKMAAIAGALNRQAQRRFFLNADVRSPPVILKNLLQIGGAVSAPSIHAIESLRVFTRIVVDLELVVSSHFELVVHSSRLHVVLNIGFRFEMLMWQLEAVVPKRVLARTPLQGFFPVVDAIVLPRPPLDVFVGDFALARQVG